MSQDVLAAFSSVCRWSSGIVHVHELQCDALVLHSTGKVEHVPLPNFPYDDAESLKARLWTYLRSHGLMDQAGDSRDVEDVEEGREAGADDEEGADDLCEILGDLCKAVVQPVMQVVHGVAQVNLCAEYYCYTFLTSWYQHSHRFVLKVPYRTLRGV